MERRGDLWIPVNQVLAQSVQSGVTQSTGSSRGGDRAEGLGLLGPLIGGGGSVPCRF